MEKDRLQYAYNIEGQAIAVQEAQKLGKLSAYTAYADDIKAVDEAGLNWYILNEFSPMLFRIPIANSKFYSGDCDEEVVRGHKTESKLTIISSREELRLDIGFGRVESVIAAVLTEDNKVLYRSPGFDLEAFKKDQSLRKVGNEGKE